MIVHFVMFVVFTDPYILILLHILCVWALTIWKTNLVLWCSPRFQGTTKFMSWVPRGSGDVDLYQPSSRHVIFVHYKYKCTTWSRRCWPLRSTMSLRVSLLCTTGATWSRICWPLRNTMSNHFVHYFIILFIFVSPVLFCLYLLWFFHCSVYFFNLCPNTQIWYSFTHW